MNFLLKNEESVYCKRVFLISPLKKLFFVIYYYEIKKMFFDNKNILKQKGVFL